MLKKLRLKFILINMTIVTIMLGAIFCLLYYSTCSNLERESIQMMESIALNPLQLGQPEKYHKDVRLPYFSVIVNHTGEATEIGGGFFDMSDRDFLNELLNSTLCIHTKAGELEEYNLRFLVNELPIGRCIVFADMTSEQSTLHNLVQTSLVIGGVAFLIFLGISIILARWAVKPVDLAWQQQKQFIADASHELKTPLTVIATDAELLNAPDCPESDRESLSGGILTMALQMRGLVESLLDLARVDSTASKEERSIASFSDIVSEAAMLFEPVYFEKGLSLQYEIEPDVLINGIPAHLRQLPDILLDNAGKYSADGGRVFVKLSRSSHKYCLLEVSNQGEPLSRDEAKNIFKRFYRADKARAMNHSYGLGLSIAQNIVTEHHGKIWVESEGGYNRFFAEISCRQ